MKILLKLVLLVADTLIINPELSGDFGKPL